MNGLRELQRDFHSAVIRGNTGMHARIVSNARADAATRLGIYVDAYRLRLLEVLTSDYPGLLGLLGDEAFDTLGRAYIDAWPSQAPSVRWFGCHMPRFLSETRPYSTRAILAEMAAFEWTQSTVFDAAGAAAISVEEVAARAPDSWAGMRLRLQPFVQRLDLYWNIPALWLALDKKQPLPTPEVRVTSLSWLFWRADFDIHWRSVDDDEARAIDVCRDNGSFGELCERLGEWHTAEQAPVRAAGLLKRWLSEGLIMALA